jgi:DNA-nicking Smr family endonuclease
MAQKKSDHENSALFQEAMKSVTPLSSNNKIHYHPPKVTPKTPANNTINTDWMDNAVLTNPVSQKEILFYSQADLSYQDKNHLKKSEYPLDDKLDLHGLTLDQAKEQLALFLTHAKQHNHRSVLVVHGKGLTDKSQHPLLKNAVNKWLQDCSDIQAFCSAPPRLGGAGALIVLLYTHLPHDKDTP